MAISHNDLVGRRWLERLIRGLTFIAPIEQNTSIISNVQREIFGKIEFAAVRYSLEELLWYRLGKEWDERSDFTSLLEQMQLADAFGTRS